MSERRIERPGSSLVYSVTGSGPPVVLGHSLLCQRSMWDAVTGPLASHYTFINVGLRGHGESSATAPFALSDLVDDWLAILDAEAIERAALCGLSTGGMTAMRLALKAPERVAGLALVDTDAGREGWFDRAQYNLLGAMYRHTGLIPVGKVARSMFGPTTLQKNRSRVDELVATMRRFDRKQASHAMMAIFGRRAVDVSPIKHPTMVVVGEHDAALPPARSQRLADAIEGARLEVIEDAGHLTAVEQPAALVTLLESFLPRCFATA